MDIARLIELLRQHHLLEPAQLDELASTPFADAATLVNDLVQRGWLTSYQSKRLLEDRADQLLLGSYVLVDKLGEGGMGTVFKARNWKLGKLVALKVIRKERLDSDEAVRRFQREIRAAAALNHPNIVHAYDADVSQTPVGGTHLLVMEYVEGTDLAKLVKQQGPRPIATACDYIRQAALGLQHAHEHKLVHRDIKPHNLLLASDGKVKILDMGLARIIHTSDASMTGTTMTREGSVMGTPDYMAPEQAMEAHDVDIRADLYSLGCTFYFLLTGKPPFAGLNMTEKLIAHQFDEIRPVEALRPDVPSGVSAIVTRLLRKKPEDRYQTPDALAAALEEGLRTGDWRAPSVSEGSAPTGVPAAASPESLSVSNAPGWSSIVSPGASPLDAEMTREDEEWRQLRRHLVVGGSLLASLVVIVGLLAWQPWQGTNLRKAAPSPDAEPSNLVKRKETAPALPKISFEAGESMKPYPVGHESPPFPIQETADPTGPFRGQAVYFDQRTGKDVVYTVRTSTPIRTMRWKGAAMKDMTIDILDLKGNTVGRGGPFKGGNAWGEFVVACDPCTECRVTIRNHASEWLFIADVRFNEGSTQPANDAWIASVQKLPPEQQVEAVTRKLQELNPGFDGKVKHKIENGVVTALALSSQTVTDISPVRALSGMTDLAAHGHPNGGKLTDLSPLKGMSLAKLTVSFNPKLVNLTPLEGIPLTWLHIQDCPAVSDLSPVRGMRLTYLNCGDTAVADLSPLQGMPLVELECSGSRVVDLKPLNKAKLTRLVCYVTGISDLSPVAGMPLTVLDCRHTKVSDFSPLKHLPLKQLGCDFIPTRDAGILRSIKTLETINGKPAAEFWVEVELQLKGVDQYYAGPWRSLFNGKDLDGWTLLPSDKDLFTVTVADDQPVILARGNSTNSLRAILTNDDFENFHFRAECRWLGTVGNSGIYYHASATTNHVSLQIGLVGPSCTGMLTAVGNNAVDVTGIKDRNVVRFQPDAPNQPVSGQGQYAGTTREVTPGKWSVVEVLAFGDRVVHVVDGAVNVVGTNLRTRKGDMFVALQKGKIGLEAVTGEIHFRNLEVRPLKAIPPQYLPSKP